MIKVWQLGLLLVVAMLVGAKAQKDGKQYWDKMKAMYPGKGGSTSVVAPTA
jgi:hypothetical protein